MTCERVVSSCMIIVRAPKTPLHVSLFVYLMLFCITLSFVWPWQDAQQIAFKHQFHGWRQYFCLLLQKGGGYLKVQSHPYPEYSTVSLFNVKPRIDSPTLVWLHLDGSFFERWSQLWSKFLKCPNIQITHIHWWIEISRTQTNPDFSKLRLKYPNGSFLMDFWITWFLKAHHESYSWIPKPWPLVVLFKINWHLKS